MAADGQDYHVIDTLPFRGHLSKLDGQIQPINRTSTSSLLESGLLFILSRRPSTVWHSWLGKFRNSIHILRSDLLGRALVSDLSERRNLKVKKIYGLAWQYCVGQTQKQNKNVGSCA